MDTVEYCLFRYSLILPSQQSWFHYPVSRTDVFLAALREKAFTRVREGYRWHIGNVKLFSETSGYFRIGRTTRTQIEKFDEESGNFVEEQQETSPYTHCVFDSLIGFIGIAKKSSLSPTPEGIARRIVEVLSRTTPIVENEIEVEIGAIPDPDSFLREIAEAYAVKKFTATFHGPNPIDADEVFQRPLANLLAKAGGKKGRAELSGDDLDRDVLATLARSSAVTGNEASARIRRERGKRSVKVNLRGTIVGAAYDEEQHDPRQVLEELEGLYRRVGQRDETSTHR